MNTLFDNALVKDGNLKMVKILPSQHGCPSCGGLRWYCYSLRRGGIRPAAGHIPLMDISVISPSIWDKLSSWKSRTEIDVCTNCGATISV